MTNEEKYIKIDGVVSVLSDEEEKLLLPIWRYQIETENNSRLFPEIIKLEQENDKTIIVIDDVWKDKLLEYSDLCKEYDDFCYAIDEVTSGYTGHYLEIFVCKIDDKSIYLHENELFTKDFMKLRFPELSVELIKALPYLLKRCHDKDEHLFSTCLSQKDDKYFIKLGVVRDYFFGNFL